tara:strand:- start:427 stop:741 length:315 start_codon:yes stop_codon:yes gene_type:complete
MHSNIFPIRPNHTHLEQTEPRMLKREEVRKLAAALVIALNIAPGKALILSLGQGHEASNFEAVESWVRTALAREQLQPGRFALQTLLPALDSRLHTISETLPQL